jgi:2-polyprenyl-3-methyl-5-hydroxy-6-metoxy-1,4-benzoquinol methylase
VGVEQSASPALCFSAHFGLFQEWCLAASQLSIMPVHKRYHDFVEDQREFFDELITEDWNAYISDDWDTARRYEIAKLFEFIKPETILDVGCGCGFHDLAMADYSFVKEVVGIDYSEKSILKANDAYPHPKVSRRVADLKCDVPRREYDLVVSFQVIEHLQDTRPFWEYCERACRSGGHIAIGTPNRNRLDNRLRFLQGKPSLLLDPMHAHEFTKHELIKNGREYGLIAKAHFGVLLSSLIYPWLTMKPYKRALEWGTRIPALASGMVTIFAKP